jgi:hypothetical protein
LIFVLPDRAFGHDELPQLMTHYQPESYSILVASVIPLVFLYLIKWLNFFETHRFRLILLALVWGAISVELSYQVSHPMALVLGKAFLSTHTAPLVEKSSISSRSALSFAARRAFC